MKTAGLIGGMSWESTIPYYSVMNRIVGERLGGLHSARIILYSVDFDEIEGVILGCTEIGMLLRAADADVPLFDTAMIHAEAAALFALSAEDVAESRRGPAASRA